MPSADHTTELLLEVQRGDRAAVDQLLPLVYDELRRIAHAQLRRERPDHTLSTTGLVHEAYLKLINLKRASWQSRVHFCAIASKAMRQILIQHARKHNAQKRGGSWHRLSLDDTQISVEEKAGALVALDDALTHLAERDERLAQIVECRFFGGMSVEETAEALGVSVRTVARDWARAKAYLHRLLQEPA